jgi:hypothetical protein
MSIRKKQGILANGTIYKIIFLILLKILKLLIKITKMAENCDWFIVKNDYD